MEKKTNRYQELDALRGIAAIMVVLFHFTMGRNEAKLGFKLGVTGPEMFFIISGFVIFMSINKVKTSREFIINRISRLYPTYWSCVTFTSLLIVVSSFYTHSSINLIEYIGNMTMFQFYLLIPNIDGPYWTMIIEMVFYVLILIIFNFKLIKYLKPIGLILSIIPVVLSYLFYNNNKFVFILIYYVPLLQFMPLFFAGIVFYKIYNNENNKILNYFILMICFVCQILMYNFAGRSRSYISQNEYSGMIVLYFLIFTLFANKKLKVIVSPLTLFFGKISFALYLIHQYVSTLIIIPFFVDKCNLNFWIASLFIAFPVVIGLATIVTFYIEVPLSKRLKEKLRTTTRFSLRPEGMQ